MLGSHWTIPAVLSHLTGFCRMDDGGDLLACRLAGGTPHRYVYIYLYGGDPRLIRYDLEDESIEGAAWDHAVHRGSVTSPEQLRPIV